MELKKLIKSIIIRFIIAVIFISILNYFATNAIVNNEVALGQLNGGNEGFIAHELYNKYRAASPFINSILVMMIMTPCFKALAKEIRHKKELKEMKETKENNNEKDN